VRVHRISEFLREARAEPNLLELCRAEQKSVKVIFRSKARQQGWAKSFCTRRNEEIAEAVVAVARFAEKYGVAVGFFASFFCGRKERRTINSFLKES